MTRALMLLLLFLGLAIVQTSFFSSLSGAPAYAPLVLAAGVYMLQHVGDRSGAFWIAGFGLFLDALAIPSFPLESIAYVVAAVAAMLSARHLFSNRSWYGLAACGLVSVASLGVARAGVLGIVWLQHPERVSWPTYWDTLLWNAILIVVLLSIFFTFARQIRGFLKSAFLVSRDRDTL